MLKLQACVGQPALSHGKLPKAGINARIERRFDRSPLQGRQRGGSTAQRHEHPGHHNAARRQALGLLTQGIEALNRIIKLASSKRLPGRVQRLDIDCRQRVNSELLRSSGAFSASSCGPRIAPCAPNAQNNKATVKALSEQRACSGCSTCLNHNEGPRARSAHCCNQQNTFRLTAPSLAPHQ